MINNKNSKNMKKTTKNISQYENKLYNISKYVSILNAILIVLYYLFFYVYLSLDNNPSVMLLTINVILILMFFFSLFYLTGFIVFAKRVKLYYIISLAIFLMLFNRITVNYITQYIKVNLNYGIFFLDLLLLLFSFGLIINKKLHPLFNKMGIYGILFSVTDFLVLFSMLSFYYEDLNLFLNSLLSFGIIVLPIFGAIYYFYQYKFFKDIYSKSVFENRSKK